MPNSETRLVTTTISPQALKALAEQRFGDMVKGVIDVQTGALVLGGELHADQEAVLLQNGAEQADLWGFNIYVDEPFPSNIEFDSMINIRPSHNNRSRTVEDPAIQQQILGWLQKKIC